MTKLIVVTGARGALGSAVLARLRADGHSTFGIDLAAAREGEADFVGGVDLSRRRAAIDAMHRIAATQPIGGLVNVAGGFVWEEVAGGADATWERMYQRNVATALNATYAAIDRLAPGAAIVNVGAAAAAKAAAGMGAYAAAKSAVARLTEALADELKPRDIRVNAVLPSIIDTPDNRRAMGEEDAPNWVRPAELAAVIAFLLSDEARAITGASIPVVGKMI
ncbi:SDR family oxidoreductase [Sphingomonas flavalba]|uniref:SDR family oxidoreductase n=1 Tax=Sphingomonas flavalba TaxID=2559804 RepID=UPI0039DF5150